MGKANSSYQFPKSTTDSSEGSRWNATKALLTLWLLAAGAQKYDHTPIISAPQSCAANLGISASNAQSWKDQVSFLVTLDVPCLPWLRAPNFQQ